MVVGIVAFWLLIDCYCVFSLFCLVCFYCWFCDLDFLCCFIVCSLFAFVCFTWSIDLLALGGFCFVILLFEWGVADCVLLVFVSGWVDFD